MKINKLLKMGMAGAVALTLSNTTYAGPKEMVDLSQAVKGPLGYAAAPAGDIQLSSAEISKIKGKGYKAALVWHTGGHWINAVTRGARDQFAKLGIKVVAETNAQFDSARQANDVESVMALNPDVILTLVLDGVSAKAAFKPAVDKGVKLVLLSNPIKDFTPNNQYMGIVTDDMYGMGRSAAELMRDAIGGKGKVGFIYHDADYFITNNRDNSFRTVIMKKETGFENITIANEKGFTNPADTGSIASAMILQNPDIKGIYVAWDGAAEQVVEALRANGRSDVKVVTHDLGANNLLDMAKGGNMYGTVADRPYDIGAAMARLAGYGLIGKKAPEFSIVSYDKTTKQNIAEVWKKSFKVELPNTLKNALK